MSVQQTVTVSRASCCSSFLARCSQGAAQAVRIMANSDSTVLAVD